MLDLILPNVDNVLACHACLLPLAEYDPLTEGVYLIINSDLLYLHSIL